MRPTVPTIITMVQSTLSKPSTCWAAPTFRIIDTKSDTNNTAAGLVLPQHNTSDRVLARWNKIHREEILIILTMIFKQNFIQNFRMNVIFPRKAFFVG